MDDLWPRFSETLEGPGLAGVHLVRTLERTRSRRSSTACPTSASVIGLGGGQAIDVAKFIAWRRRLPLFQVPDGDDGQRAVRPPLGLREDGIVRYRGFAIPEAVYVDFDVIASAPAGLNRAGVGDILCYHTAHLDWRLTRDLGKLERRSGRTTSGSSRRRASGSTRVLGALDAIHDVTDHGIRTLMEAHRWGGDTFHAVGLEPAPHRGRGALLLLQPREARPGQHFIHGQPVGLGHRARVASLQDNGPERDGWPRCIAPASTSAPRRWA